MLLPLVLSKVNAVLAPLLTKSTTDWIFPLLKTIGGVLVAIFAFGFLIFIHELGHFITAKRSNVRVNEFSIGMGPAIWKKVKGETTYALRLIPFGGFVAMEGEDSESEDNRSFKKASRPRQALILLSGAAMNFLLGMLILFVLSSLTPRFGTTRILQFKPDAVSAQFLQVGDEIKEINEKKVSSYNDVVHELMWDKDGLISFTVLRNDQRLQIPAYQFPMQEVQEDYFMVDLDFYFAGEDRTVLGVIKDTAGRIKQVTLSVWTSLGRLVTGQLSVNQLSGPVGITKEISTVAATGNWKGVAEFAALISINLGIMNLLPVPALDGGRLLFLLIESIRKKKLNPKIELYTNGVGLIVLLGLMALIALKDIIKLF